MKQLLMMLSILVYSVTAWSQQNILSISGGYVFTNVSETDVKATGWRINGVYEFNPQEGLISRSISFGLFRTSSEYENQNQTSNYKLNSFPIYYSHKVMFVKEKFKGFLKGSLGVHLSQYSRTGSLAEVSAEDVGFYGGAGFGGMMFLKNSLFINVEYEWAFLSNSYYKNGFVNTVLCGIGYKF
jgi:hypothetical protein